jgi:hypothetical protein
MNERMGLAMILADLRGDRDHVGVRRSSGSFAT